MRSWSWVGVALGIVGAIAAARLLESLLFEVSGVDPIALGAAGRCAAFGCAPRELAVGAPGPRVDPMVALRQK